MEFGVRTVILFLLSFRDSFLKQQAKTIGYTLNLSSGHAGRYVSDCRRTNQGILVCQSHHPPAGLFVGVLLYQIYQALHNKKISYSTGTLSEVASVALFLLFYLCAADIPKVYRYSCYYWLPVSLMILIFAFQKGGISRLLSNRFLIIGGEISYSFYLIHLFIILTYTKMAALYQWQVSWMISVPLIFGITITLSLLSYYYFEKPANKWVKRILTKNNHKSAPWNY